MGLNSAVGVRVSYLYKENRIDEIKNRVNFSFNYIAFMGCGCVFGIWGIARLFIPVFYGAGYSRSITVLYIFAPILLITAISSCLNAQYYVPIGKRAECTKFIIKGAVVNLILNYSFIPIWHSLGAVFASVIAELVITIEFWKHSNKLITIEELFDLSWKKIIAGILMLFMINLLYLVECFSDIILLIIQISIGGMTYISALIILRDKWIKQIIRQIFGKIVFL